MAIVLGFSTVAAAATPAMDPLTGLPLLPGTSGPLGNAPTRMPDAQICKSKVHAEYYPVFNSKVSVTLNWYASRLAGFHKTHGFADGRSQDAFYSADGATVVSVTGEGGQERRRHRNICRFVHAVSARASCEDDHWDQSAQRRL
jgi:hypothetical protein